MTREELIQTPEYWETLYEIECERLGIKPILKFVKPLNEEELDRLAENTEQYEDEDKILYKVQGEFYEAKDLDVVFKAGYRKICKK